MSLFRTIAVALLVWGVGIGVHAQPDYYKDHEFSRADTLRGMLRPERTCYDVHHYELD
jgi:hypothetical protein